MSQHDLLMQYKKALKDLVALLNRTTDKEDRKLLSGMVKDCEFIVEWLNTGRQPGRRRGVDRRSVYQLTKVWDPEWFEEFLPPYSPETGEYEMTLSDEFGLEEAMSGLSEKERQCYVLHIGFKYTVRQIAQELNVKKRTVETHIDRAKKKIERNKFGGHFPSTG